MSTAQELQIPRPGQDYPPQAPIPGPSEDSFTSTFGSLLPKAQYLLTTNGKIGFYKFPSSTSCPSSRVLFLHGVQTPALGLCPLLNSLHAKYPSAEFVAVDLYGHGLSETPMVPHTQPLFHQLIDELLDFLQWETCQVVGYSFGGVTCISYISSSPACAARVNSIALIAPAGLWTPHSFSPETLEGDYSTAKNYVLELLEGGELIVPADWQDRVSRGEIVAEKVREWQMENHAGHAASVVSIFRDGNVMGAQEVYEKAVGRNVPIMAVLGEVDDVVTQEQLKSVGVNHVVVVKGAGHGVVRSHVEEVVAHVERFWNGSEK